MHIGHLIRPRLKKSFRLFSSYNSFLKFSMSIAALILVIVFFIVLKYFFNYIAEAKVLGPIAGRVFGPILLEKLVELIILVFFFMLFFSNLVSALTAFFLEEDLPMLIVSPLPPMRLFIARFLTAMTESSWMSTLALTPILLAYQTTVASPWFSYLLLPFFLALLVLIPCLFSSGTVLLVANLFPVRRMKKIFQFLALLFFAAMVFFLRSLKAEKLLNLKYYDETFKNLIGMQIPSSPYSPPHRLYKLLYNISSGDLSLIAKELGIISAAALALFLLLALAAKFNYRRAWQKSFETLDNKVSGLEFLRKLMIWPASYLPQNAQAIVKKEITIFFRDPAIFSQLFMVGAVVAIYAYNLFILPLKDVPQLFSVAANNWLLYLNAPFIGFVCAAIAMRFVFPSTSMEGKAFWILKASPIQIAKVLKIKFFFYLLPMLLLCALLSAFSVYVFNNSSTPLMILSVFNAFLITFTVTAFAVNLGSVYANFEADSPLKASGSFGGFVYMVISMLYMLSLVLLQIFPIYMYMWKSFYYTSGYLSSTLFTLSLLMSPAMTWMWCHLSFKKGVTALENYQHD